MYSVIVASEALPFPGDLPGPGLEKAAARLAPGALVTVLAIEKRIRSEPPVVQIACLQFGQQECSRPAKVLQAIRRIKTGQ